MRNPIKITGFKRTNGNKFQPTFQQLVVREQSAINITALMNEGDDSFNQKLTLAYPAYTALAIAKYFGVDIVALESLEVGESLDLEILEPTVNGVELNIQINESLIDSDDVRMQYAKKIVDKSTGEETYFAVGNKFIFRTTTVVGGEPVHSIIKDAVRTSKPVDSLSAILKAEGMAAL